jgi:putative Holliday junction resolvase
VLALDLGTRRIGVALSDELRLTVRPLGAVDVVGPKRDAKAIRELVGAEKPALVVIGLPLLGSGVEGASAQRARDTGQDLARRLELPHELVDEWGTTLDAQDILRERRGGRGASRGSPKPEDDVDALAAAVLLEAWLAGRRT